MKITVAVLIYRYAESSDTIQKIFGKFEEIPIHSDGERLISLTGVVKKTEKPRETTVRKIKIQTGYKDVKKKELLFLGKIRPDRESDTTTYLYSINVDDKERTLQKKKKYRFKWVHILEAVKSKDPLIPCMLYKHFEKTTLN